MSQRLFLWRFLYESLFFICGFCCVLMTMMPFFKIPYYQVSFPFILSVIFYFSIFRSTFLNNLSAFVLGIFSDLLSGEPLGLSAFLYPTFFLIVSLNQKLLIQLTFVQLWGIFSFCAFIYGLILYILFSMISGVVLSGGGLIMQYIFVTLSYPLIAGLCGWLNQKNGDRV